MTEKLLQFIWQFQYFNRGALETVSGERVEVLFPGKLNTHQGPDFQNARIRIGNTLLAGAVELHIKTSQWYEHGHQDDQNYRNVILHVVLDHDMDVDAGRLPVLELSPRIASVLMTKYQSLMEASGFIPCQQSIATVNTLVWEAWKERLLAERLTHRANQIRGLLEENRFHWEEAFWWMLARNFGVTVNTDAFFAVARSIPVNVLARHKQSIHQLEALLLGQAGLLNKQFEDDYMKLLQREYRFVSGKYGLLPVSNPVHFLRMRPGSFPTIRLAQLAMLVSGSSRLFAQVLETEDISRIKETFNVTANDYWHYRYVPDQPSPFRKKHLGKDMIDNIVINTLVPFLFTYGLHNKLEQYQSRAFRWLEALGPEKNNITQGFTRLGVGAGSAFDSQALIELKHSYCDQRKCLACSVGNAILKG